MHQCPPAWVEYLESHGQVYLQLSTIELNLHRTLWSRPLAASCPTIYDIYPQRRFNRLVELNNTIKHGFWNRLPTPNTSSRLCKKAAGVILTNASSKRRENGPLSSTVSPIDMKRDKGSRSKFVYEPFPVTKVTNNPQALSWNTEMELSRVYLPIVLSSYPKLRKTPTLWPKLGKWRWRRSFFDYSVVHKSNIWLTDNRKEPSEGASK